MGLAVDTIGLHATVAGATGKAATVATGDTLTVRAFPQAATARLIGVFRQDEGATEGFVQIKSPRLANNVTGIKVRMLETPAAEPLGPYAVQSLYSTDTLVVNMSGTATATHTTFAGLQVYYSTLPGVAARLHMWGDISGSVQNIFTQTVAVDAATAGTWYTVLSNHTADLMQANTTYALLGYDVDLAYGVVGVKALETGNLRVCGPGTTKTAVTANWFVSRSQELGLPYIPVVNSNNRGNVNVTANAGKAANGKVTLIWGQLSTSLAA